MHSPLTNLICNVCTLPGDSVEFMSWFLNAMHSALNGTKKLSSSILNKTFRGKMKVYSKKVPPLEMVSTPRNVFFFVFFCRYAFLCMYEYYLGIFDISISSYRISLVK